MGARSWERSVVLIVGFDQDDPVVAEIDATRMVGIDYDRPTASFNS
jgi:hypothetical protein